MREAPRSPSAGDTDPPCNEQGTCITCGDVASAMVVVRVDEARGLALCEDPEGVRSTVEVELVAPVTPGDGVLVHAGTALVRLDEPEEAA